MALADRLEETPRRAPGFACSMGRLLDSLPEPEAAALNRMLHELGWSQARIYEAITDEGHEVGRQTIGRHRSRSCSCFKQAPPESSHDARGYDRKPGPARRK